MTHGLDVAALSRWLATRVADFEGPLHVEPFSGGQSNPTYLLTTPRNRYVMRAKPAASANLLASAHAIEREFTVLQALACSAIPVPTVHALCEDEQVIGRVFYIMDFVQGRVLWNQALPELRPSERGAVYDEMNRIMAALHTLDFSQLGLAEFGRPGNYVERQIARWSRQIVDASQLSAPPDALIRLIDWLPAHLPKSARDASLVALVHGDYRLDNLMFDVREPRAVAVMDWELSTLGHALADFSYHCMAWYLPPGPMRGIAGLDHTAVGLPTESAYKRHYCERTGLVTFDAMEADWSFYMAYNFFRSAAIVQAILIRRARGIASNPQAADVSLELVEMLASKGLYFANGYRAF